MRQTAVPPYAGTTPEAAPFIPLLNRIELEPSVPTTPTLLDLVQASLTVENIRNLPIPTAESFIRFVDVIGADVIIHATPMDDRHHILGLLAMLGAPDTFYVAISSSAPVRAILQHWMEEALTRDGSLAMLWKLLPVRLSNLSEDMRLLNALLW
jgi:hypothetical protein